MSADAQVYKDDSGEWRWRLKAANGEIVAIGESYRSRRDARRGLDAAAAAFKAASEPDPEPDAA